MMRKFAPIVLILLALGIATNVDAQTTRKKTTSSSTKKTTTQKTSVANENVAQATGDVQAAPVPKPDRIKLDTIKKSNRPDAIVDRNLVKDRTPLAYEHLREDDAVYRQRVWRELDINEKMNLPFRYKADEDNGNQRFINILLNAIKNGEVTAFNPIDDRFTTPMTLDEIGEKVAGKCDSAQTIDWVKDPTGSKGLLKDTTICSEFNPDAISKYRIKEEWVFDKESSRMFVRILGVAPVKDYVNEVTGQVMGSSALFWVYYPDMRPVLAKFEAYNSRNFGARMSWEELFESRYFSSYITKSTVDNPYDLTIKQIWKDPILSLLEGDNVKEKIFNYEQDLWSY
jgi:gliding motility associated protien GldN